MSDRIPYAFVEKQWLLLGKLCFSQLLSTTAARSLLAKLTTTCNTETSRTKQLLADVSVISRSDAGTGIQRVVRELLQELIANPPGGYDVQPIFATRSQQFRYADEYRFKLTGEKLCADSCQPVQVHAGDIFIGMDFAAHTVPNHQFLLSHWKVSGVKFYFFVYDLLPVLRSEWFTPGLVKSYRNWIKTVAKFADGIVCISRSVSEELEQWLADEFGKSLSTSIPITSFRLSGDICNFIPSLAYPEGPSDLLNQIAKRPTILMVGTIEPRKGYAQVLAAFEILWKQNKDIGLIIVGKAGWNMDELIRRLRRHPEVGKRLIWLDGAADYTLHAIYESVDGLLMASEGEGFGLPIVEAARYHKPILARDIPIFREIAGEHARYFSSSTSIALAKDVDIWIELIKKGLANSSLGMQRVTWAQSAQQMLHNIGLNRGEARSCKNNQV